MSNEYKEGPRSEPWECVENKWAGRGEPFWWVQRAGWDDRTDADGGYERRFGSTTDCGVMEPRELAARLNRLDALETALTRLADAVVAYTAAVNSPLPNIDYIGVDTAATVMAAAEAAAREVLR